MSVTYDWLDWEFDVEAWARALNAALRHMSAIELAELLEIDHTTVLMYASGKLHPDTPYPQMTKFIKVCNLLDLDPRSFWSLEEK